MGKKKTNMKPTFRSHAFQWKSFDMRRTAFFRWKLSTGKHSFVFIFLSFTTMAFFCVDIHLRRYKEIILLERIKLSSTSEWFYFKPIHQPICLHASKFNNPFKFKSFHTEIAIKLTPEEMSPYLPIARASTTLQFRRRNLLPEADYFSQFVQTGLNRSARILRLLDQHNRDCSACKLVQTVRKQIRKRDKLTDDEREMLAFRIGQNWPVSKLQETFNISKRTALLAKRKYQMANHPVHQPPAVQLPPNPQPPNQPPVATPKPVRSSLTDFERQQIARYAEQNIFATSFEIKVNCHLRVCLNTIRNYLADIHLQSFVAREQVAVNAAQRRLRDQFAVLVQHFDQAAWDTIIFSDEKTLQSYYKGKIRIIRQRGQGRDRRFQFRKNKQSRHKINLYGFITANGVGELFVLPDRTKSHHFINAQHYHILPSMIQHAGPNFVLQQDGASIHVSKLSLTYWQFARVPLLV